MTDGRKRKYYDWHSADLWTVGELKHELQSGPRVLDIGCGTGWLSHRLVEAGATSAVGVDVDAGAIEVMNTAEDQRVSGLVGFADDLPFGAASFDLIVAKDIIEHMPNPAKLITEAHRVLGSGGKLYIATPAPQARNFWDDYTHVRPFTEKALRSMLEDNRFEIETLYYSGNFPLVGRYMRATGSRRLPAVVKWMARIPFLRNNVHAIAVKR